MSDTWTAAEDYKIPVTVTQTAEMTTDLAITTETTVVLYVIIAVVPAILVVAIVGLVYKRAKRMPELDNGGHQEHNPDMPWQRLGHLSINLSAPILAMQHAPVRLDKPQLQGVKIHREETGTSTNYDKLDLTPISRSLPAKFTDAQYLCNENSHPTRNITSAVYMNVEDGHGYEQFPERESKEHQYMYLDLPSPAGGNMQQATARDCKLIQTETTGIDTQQTIYNVNVLTPISRDFPAKSIEAQYPYKDSDQPARDIESAVYEKISERESEAHTYIYLDLKSAANREENQEPTCTTTGVDAQQNNYDELEPAPIVQNVLAESIDAQYLYNDIGRPARDMASAVYEQIPERKSEAHQYVYLDLPPRVGSDYADCNIVCMQNATARENESRPTRVATRTNTTRIDAHQTNYDELELASISRAVPAASMDARYLYNNNGRHARDMARAAYVNYRDRNSYENTTGSEVDHQYVHLDSPTGSDYADFEIIRDI